MPQSILHISKSCMLSYDEVSMVTSHLSASRAFNQSFDLYMQQVSFSYIKKEHASHHLFVYLSYVHGNLDYHAYVP